MIRVAVIASTSGSVLSKTIEVPYVKDRIVTVISDRDCGAIDIAKRFAIRSIVYNTNNAYDFSNYISDFFLKESPDLLISFYTKLFRGNLLNVAKWKIINFHPSILPACPGQDGFEDTIRSGSRFIGGTVHYVDGGIDTGRPIIQSAIPFDPNLKLPLNRHRLFVSQCKMLIQTINWFERGVVKISDAGDVFVEGASYDIGEFSPNIDFEIANSFNCDLS